MSTPTPSAAAASQVKDGTTPNSLKNDEIERYSRQLLLPAFGVRGQCRLRDRRVLIIGMGGLGCPAALYLAGAGVGVLGLVDRPGDVVERSNLHRQMAHSDAHVGIGKVESAAVAISALNPLVRLETHKEIVPRNAVELVRAYDLVLDCTDNVMSRYLVNDACAVAGVPLVSGSAIGLEGQLTVYGLKPDTPCYRCIFPQPPPPSCVGSCDSAGVLGPVPGTIGTLQALEALKVLADIRGAVTLAGKLLLFDAAESSFRTVKLRKRMPTCSACGESPRFDVAHFDYAAFAAGELNGTASSSSTDGKLDSCYRISPQVFASMRKALSTPSPQDAELPYLLIDVRPEAQFAMCALEEARSVPLTTLSSQAVLQPIAQESRTVVVVCRRGNASQKAVQILLGNGASNVVDVRGGLQAWHHEIDGNFPLY